MQGLVLAQKLDQKVRIYLHESIAAKYTVFSRVPEGA
jgi:hypothetical protein